MPITARFPALPAHGLLGRCLGRKASVGCWSCKHSAGQFGPLGLVQDAGAGSGSPSVLSTHEHFRVGDHPAEAPCWLSLGGGAARPVSGSRVPGEPSHFQFPANQRGGIPGGTGSQSSPAARSQDASRHGAYSCRTALVRSCLRQAPTLQAAAAKARAYPLACHLCHSSTFCQRGPSPRWYSPPSFGSRVPRGRCTSGEVPTAAGAATLAADYLQTSVKDLARQKAQRETPQQSIARVRALLVAFKGWVPADLACAVAFRRGASFMQEQGPAIYVAGLIGKDHAWKAALNSVWAHLPVTASAALLVGLT